MFDNYTHSLFNKLPDLEELNKEECRRILTKAYMYSIKLRLNLVQEDYVSVDLSLLSEEELDLIEETLEDSTSNISELYFELRRLGDTLESSAVFDNKSDEDSIKASSFVAAESLSLLSTLLTFEVTTIETEDFLFSNELIYTRLEAALLYLIAGYDANALTEINEVSNLLKDFDNEKQGTNLARIEYWCLINIISFCSNELWKIKKEKPVVLNEIKSKALKRLIMENKYYMYSMLGDSIVFYVEWLIGENHDGLEHSLNLLKTINQSSYKNKYALFSEIFHLSKILMMMIMATSKRSLIHNTPLPKENGADFLKYLKNRANGDHHLKSRPFIWESAKEFISECLPGPNKHTIVNLPTGSGKSFIAELAVAQSLSKGWVLYLAPTNALVHQIRKDLKNSLRPYDNLEIRTFVGGDEYTTLENEFLDEDNSSDNFIAVMTPEKCAMTLRINPEIFQKCSLCIFDECHLLGEGIRGVTVDLVIGQILSINHRINFVLMSAMLSNPDDLLEWLNDVTNNETKISSISWKPTRSIRGAIGIEKQSFNETSQEAKEALKQKSESRKNEKFYPKFSILYSLSGIWTLNYEDYSLMELNIEGKFKVNRKKRGEDWDYSVIPESWVNNTASTIGLELASKGIPTIVFISSNRHYPFSLSRELNISDEQFRLGEIEESLLFLAEQELGIPSEVKKILVDNKIGVHTAFMLDTEKEVIERSFKNQNVKLLFATGTLAQGLNLPSVAVVIAGTRIGDGRLADTPEARNRSRALILNAIGRAGRAGFSNQSLSLVVPDEPIIYENEKSDVVKTIRQLSVLKDKDASIRVRSPLEGFLNNIINGSIQSDGASLNELTIMSMLSAGGDEDEEVNKAKEILKKTYGGYIIRQKSNEQELDKASISITKIKNDFLEKANVPEYVINIARKSGFDFFTTNVFIRIVLVYTKDKDRELISNWTIREWKDLLILCLKDMPPYYLKGLLPENPTQKPTFINKMVFSLQGEFESEMAWKKPLEWDNYWYEFSYIIDLFMEGNTLAEIARMFLKIDGEVEFSRSAGKPIPDVLAFIKDQIDIISSFAGLFVASLEEVIFNNQEIPFNLNALPLALKNGLKDYSSLFWYNYGIRNRIVAHILATKLPLGDFTNEETLKNTVFQLRKAWLNEEIEFKEITAKELNILNAAKIVITNL